MHAFRFTRLIALIALFAGPLLASPVVVGGQQANQTQEIALSEGRLNLSLPSSWEKKTPRSRIVEFEFEAKAAEGDDKGARVTIMGAGGSVKANIDRWVGQFKPENGKGLVKSKVEEKKIDGHAVHLVDIQGTYLDRPGPFVPNAIERPGYRMMGAIFVTPVGQYFLKMYGPAKTMAENQKVFLKAVESLKVKK